MIRRGLNASVGRDLLAFGLLPNLLLAAVGTLVFSVRPIINIDYLLLGILALWAPRLVVAALAMLCLLLDLIVSIAPMFFFSMRMLLHSLDDAIGLIPAAPLRASLALLAAVGALSLLMAFLGGGRGGPDRKPRAAALVMATVALLLVDVLNGSNGYLRRISRVVVPANIAGSTHVRIGFVAWHTARRPPRPLSPNPAAGSAAASLRAALAASPEALPPAIVLVIVESWGQLVDSSAAEAIIQPWRAAALAGYHLETGTAPSRGPTTAAEFRELCGLQMTSHDVRGIDLVGCVPSLLRRAGYATTALHGYRRRVFDRDEWYPRIGFDSVLFLEQLGSATNERYCGSVFRGACDHLLVDVIRERLLAPGSDRRFIYWLTLNSHVPVDSRSSSASSFDCSATRPTLRFADICLLSRAWHLVHERLAALAADSLMPATRFIVVGDHPPPLVSRSARDQFVPATVPYLDLQPRPPSPR